MSTTSLSTQEMAEFIGISRQALKKLIDNNTFESRLLDKNYRLVECKKEGRKVVYYIEEVAIIPLETWNAYTKREFPTIRKVVEYGDYCEERLVHQTLMVKDIAAVAGVTEKTINNWDNMLVERGYMKDNGYRYFRLTPSGPQQITYQEYAEHWGMSSPSKSTVEANKALDKLKFELKGIVEAENPAEKDNAINSYGVCVKVKTFLVHQFTEKYNELVNALNQRNG